MTKLRLTATAELKASELGRLERPRYTRGCLHCQRLTQSIRHSASEPDLLAFGRFFEYRSQNVAGPSEQAIPSSLCSLQRPHLTHRPATDVPYVQRPDASFQDPFHRTHPGHSGVGITRPRKTSIIWADELPGACLVQHNHVHFPSGLRSEVADPAVWKKKNDIRHDSYFQGSPYWTLDDECDRKDDNKAWLQKTRSWSRKQRYSTKTKEEIPVIGCESEEKHSGHSRLKPPKCVSIFSRYLSKNKNVRHSSMFRRMSGQAEDRSGSYISQRTGVDGFSDCNPQAQVLHNDLAVRQPRIATRELQDGDANIRSLSALPSRSSSLQEGSVGGKSQSARVFNRVGKRAPSSVRNETQPDRAEGLKQIWLMCDRGISERSQKTGDLQRDPQDNDALYANSTRSSTLSAPTFSSIKSTVSAIVSTISATCSILSRESLRSRRTASSTSTGSSLGDPTTACSGAARSEL